MNIQHDIHFALPYENAMVNLALGFCIGAHHNQKRKYTFEPYYVHCLEVAHTLYRYGEPAHVVAAGLLHDVIEDTDRTYTNIANAFGEEVANLVAEVTDISSPGSGNRAFRKALDCKHLSQSSPQGANIKLADILSNTASIVKHDRNFAKIYLPEKVEVLKVLQHASNKELLSIAETVVQNAIAALANY